MKPVLTRRRVLLARGLAVAADLLQWIAFPLFMSGATGVADGVLDVVVCVALIRLIGWHLAFLPSFVGELLPFADMVPLWTMAVFFVTRDGRDLPSVAGPPPDAPTPSGPSTKA